MRLKIQNVLGLMTSTVSSLTLMRLTATIVFVVSISVSLGARAEETLDFSNDSAPAKKEDSVDLKDTAADDAKFEKELELKLDEDAGKDAPYQAKKEAAAAPPQQDEPKLEAAPAPTTEMKPEDKDEFSDFNTGEKPPDVVKDKAYKKQAGRSADEPAKIEEPEKPIAPVENEPEPLTSKQMQADSAQAPMVSDDPDLKYEARLHEIYQQYYSKKTPDAQWQSLAGPHLSERYKINSGDNLWNISKALFGDGNYWPKVWSLNGNLTNPHLVTTNNQIRFILGDESSPPAFTVTENASTTEGAPTKVEVNTQVNNQTNNSQVNVDNSTNVQSQSTAQAAAAPGTPDSASEEPEIPPPLKVSRPVLKRLPPSLPEWQASGLSQGNYDETGIDFVKRKISDVRDQIPLISYITESLPESLGRPAEIEVGNKMASTFQYIYVLMKKGEGQIGETFLAISSRGENESSTEAVKGFLGYSVDVQGEVQLVEKVDSKPGVDGEMFRAIVLKIINPVTTDSHLVRGKIEHVQITENGPRTQIVAQIIGGSYFNRRQVYGSQSIAYLNRGENDGLKVGHVLPIRANREVRNEDTLVAENVRPIGWLRVVKTSPHFSTAVIVRAWSDVLTGDLTGSGSLMAPGTKKAEIEEKETSDSKSLINELDQEEDLGAPPSQMPSGLKKEQAAETAAAKAEDVKSDAATKTESPEVEPVPKDQKNESGDDFGGDDF